MDERNDLSKDLDRRIDALAARSSRLAARSSRTRSLAWQERWIAGVEAGLADAERGDFASEEEITLVLNKHTRR